MTLRVVRSGLRPARENLSLTEALCRLRREGRIPDTLRLQHFPPSAIIGRHQLLHREVRVDWTAARGVEVARRMTGGGAIVMGPGILGWELVLGRAGLPQGLDAVSALLCGGVASALRSLGVAAAYRPRNDVEVGGRKVSGTGGYVDGEVLVFQGTVLVALDLDLMTGALRLPTEKLGRHGLAALVERVADLQGLLGTEPPMGAVESALADGLATALGTAQGGADLTPDELALSRRIHDDEIGTDDFVHGHGDLLPREGRVLTGAARTPGGSVEVVLKLRDGADGVLDQAFIAGDFFASPPGAIQAVEAALRGRRLADIAEAARAALGPARILGATPEAFAAALAEAATTAMEGAA